MTSPGQGGRSGPVAAPKAVTGRRMSRSMLALAVVLVVVSALGVAAVVGRARGGALYLAAARAIGFGQQITDGDLVEVRASLDPAVRAVPAGQRGEVVGRYAQAPLLAGQLLTEGVPLAATFPGAGRRMVTVALKAELSPAQPLHPGAKVQLVEVPTSSGGDDAPSGSATFPGTVVAVRTLDFGGGTTVDVIVAAADAARIAAAAAGNRVALVVDGGP